MSRYNLVRKTDYADDSTAQPGLVAYPIPIVPIVLFALRLKSSRYFYDDAASWLLARQSLHQMGANMLREGMREITNRQEQLYVMLRAYLGGMTHSVTGTGTSSDPYIWEPPLPLTISPDADYSDSAEYGFNSYLHDIRVYTGKLISILSSALFGYAYDDSWPPVDGTHKQLEDINTKLDDLAASGTGDKLDTIITDLELLAALLGI